MHDLPPAHAPGAFPGGPGPSYAASFIGAETAQALLDAEHLRLLRIGYFISAAQTAIFVPFGLLYAGMGLLFSQLPAASSPPPPPMVSWVFGLLGTAVALFAGLGTGLKLLTAMRLKQRRWRGLCLLTAGLSCLEIPYGTTLGVWTFMVLGRASVRRAFDQAN
jgi:hypothetical protein